ncbi:hypothetical protein [Nocardia stercoris]|uniref:Uncharacterized protein n=1 Tax=Nocardia stercoris TaxID=2483361 RepID=A0A3M2L2W7_9NOCA|nr:hypothetical protein [Nocardia stercoris]RMI30863.1 hypothetical protein EBN03_19645 [Nocardia stercoris]
MTNQVTQWHPPADPAARPEGPPAQPEDVRTAVLLWQGAIAAGVVRVLAGAATIFANRNSLAQQGLEQQDMTPEQVGFWAGFAAIAMAVIGLALIVGVAGVVAQLSRGRLWARGLADGLGVLAVFGAIGTLLGGLAGADAGIIGGGLGNLVSGGAAILQGVLLGGAVFLCHRKDSEIWFRAVGR